MHGKKILILVHSLVGGGADRVTLNLAESWSKAGAHIVVATLIADPDIYAVPVGVRRIALNIFGKSRSLLSKSRKFIILVPVVWRLLRTERPDIVMGIMDVSSILVAATRTKEMIAIGTEHTHPPMLHTGAIRKTLRRLLYSRLDAVVALTSESSEWLRSNTLARKVVSIPNFITLPLAEHEPRIAVHDVIAKERKLLLAIGWLVKHKGFDRLIHAFAKVAPHHPDWSLAILGEGNLRSQLETQATLLGISDRVHLPGHAGNLPDWYHAADALAMTSLFEGFPMVLLEALAHGCAVVSVDCNTGPRHIICNGENGILVAQDDPSALVAGLDRLLGDKTLRSRLASCATKVLDTFSENRVQTMWQSLFDELSQQRQ